MNKLKSKEIFRKDFVLSATNNTRVDIDPSYMPSGLIRGFWVRWETAAITGFGSAQTNFMHLLRAATWGARVPNFNVATAIDGQFWDNITTQLLRFALDRTTPTASAGMGMYYLPYSWFGTDRRPAYRQKDTALLNIGNKALPFISMLLGPCTDLSSAATACTVTVTVVADYDPIVKPGGENPVNPVQSGDQPGRFLELLLDNKSDLAVTCQKVFTTGGPRDCIGVFARELDASGNEVSDIFTKGVATPSKFVFTRGDSDAYNEDQKVNSLDSIEKARFGVAPVAGYHYNLFARNGKLADALPLRDGATFRLNMDNLNTVASRVLQTLQVNTVDIPGEQVKAATVALGGDPSKAPTAA